MKVLLVNAREQDGGAARATRRLHDALRASGVDSTYLVQKPSARGPGVVGGMTLRSRALGMAQSVLELSARNLLRAGADTFFSPAIAPGSLRTRVREHDPDVVHLNWINDGFVPIEALAPLGRPLVWTLHDSWPFTGGCHVPHACTRYEARCGACPALCSSRELDASRLTWLRKARAWRDISLHVVAPSRWMARAAQRSSLFGDRPIEVIPNGLDTTLFRPIPRATARETLRLPADERILVYGGYAPAADPQKGFAALCEASRVLVGMLGRAPSRPTSFALFGDLTARDAEALALPARALGRLHDELSLALLYSAADGVLLPSQQENLPNVVAEGLACGTPAVAFDTGGVGDLVRDGETGYLVPPFDTRAFAGAMHALVTCPDPAPMRVRARGFAEATLAAPVVARRYVALYRRAIVAPGGDAPSPTGRV